MPYSITVHCYDTSIDILKIISYYGEITFILTGRKKKVCLSLAISQYSEKDVLFLTFAKTAFSK